MSPEISFVRPKFMLAQLNSALAPFASTPVRKAAPKRPTAAQAAKEREEQDAIDQMLRARRRKPVADEWLREVAQKQKLRRGIRLSGGVCRPFANRHK